jgi:indolepyruvate ferredoxin oxidoreductase beta subunit
MGGEKIRILRYAQNDNKEMKTKVKKLDLLITGVGGQGVVLASDIIGEAAIAAGFDVKKTDTLGMAQRGGSVVSNVRIAEKVWSPLIKEGEVDVLLAFEKIEAGRWSHLLKSGATVIINSYEQPPLSVSLGQEKYPTDAEIKKALQRRTDRIFFLDAQKKARELGNIRTFNIFMLGCLSVFTPIDAEIWKDSISRGMPEKLRDINLKAFDMGRKEIENVRI